MTDVGKTAFITGVTGQDGSILAKQLLEKGYTVVGMKRRTSLINTDRLDEDSDVFFHPNFKLEYGNMTDSSCLYRLLQKYQPNEIYNLAAQSHVRVSFEVPEETLDVVAGGTLKLLEAYRQIVPYARFYQASSSEMYGDNPEAPQNEETKMMPASPYACFPKGTKIVVQKEVNGKNGKRRLTTGTKDISLIEPGDIVLTYNEETSQKEWNTVLATDSRQTTSLFDVTFSNGNHFSLTGNHPVFVIDKGWVNAESLKPGDKVIQYRYPELRSRLMKGKTDEEIYGKTKAENKSKKASSSMKVAWKMSENLNREQWANRCSKVITAAWKNENSGLNSEKYRQKLKLQLDEARILSTQTFTPKRRQKMSTTTKELWRDPKFVQKQILARHSFPNKLEISFEKELEKRFPGQFKYNGDCREGILVEGKVPDFVHLEKRKVIELFGNYWHTLPGKMTTSDLKKHYTRSNYDCHIVWEKDFLEDPEKVFKEIETFIYNPNIDIVQVQSVHQRNTTSTTVFNFEVENNHNYFAHGILVHNCAKLYAHNLCRNYREAYGLHISCGILFNHESPVRGETFVTRKITMAAARIKLGKQEILKLGNLDAKRDWGLADDYTRAMWLMLQQPEPDDYVIATGETHTVREFLEETFSLAGLNVEKHLMIDERLFRPHEVPLLLGDATKAKEKLGWTPTVTFKELVKIMYEEDFDRELNM